MKSPEVINDRDLVTIYHYTASYENITYICTNKLLNRQVFHGLHGFCHHLVNR